MAAGICPRCGAVLKMGESACAYCGCMVAQEQVGGQNAAAREFQIRAGVLERYTGAATDIIIPALVRSVAEGVFDGCRFLKSVVISDGVLEIGRKAFYNCAALTAVTIPESVTAIGEMAFLKCPRLCVINAPKRWQPLFEPPPHAALAAQWEEEGRCAYCGGALQGKRKKRCVRCGCRK